MGNSGLAKIFTTGNIVENKYRSLYDINVVDINKEEVPLSKYKGKVTLCVNVSSLHAEAPTEIAELKELASRFPKTEFEILAFPCNQFANEPGNFETIKQNYFSKYGVNFPIFSKVGAELFQNVKLVQDRSKWTVHASCLQILEKI